MWAATRAKSVAENWPRFLEVWPPLVQFAEEHGVRIGIENCPMFFTADEWPGGKNLAHAPAVWRRMFREIPSASFGLNYDPSHLVWQQMDYLRPIAEFCSRLFHVHLQRRRVRSGATERSGHPGHALGIPHAEDSRSRADRLAEVPGRAGAAGYDGPVCIEVEDRDFEGSLETRKEALPKRGVLRQCMKAVLS